MNSLSVGLARTGLLRAAGGLAGLPLLDGILIELGVRCHERFKLLLSLHL